MGLQSTEQRVSAALRTPDPSTLILHIIDRCDGNLHRAAWQLGIYRTHIYRLIRRYRLWPAVHRIRAEALSRRQD